MPMRNIEIWTYDLNQRLFVAEWHEHIMFGPFYELVHLHFIV